jgi:hypothetical protein
VSLALTHTFWSESQVGRVGVIPLIPIEVTPALTALRAYSIWTSFPEGEKVVRENEYRSAMVCACSFYVNGGQKSRGP